MQLGDLLFAPDVNAAVLASHLDALDAKTRAAQALSLNRAAQARLFEVVAGARRFTLDDLAPSTTAPLHGVRHDGRNSMPMFSRFAKLFATTPTGADERWGYNLTSSLVLTTVGPGYFVAVQQGDEVLVDYTRLPSTPLEGAPRILRNGQRLSYFVYSGTKDVVRGVSRHVSIGRAWRGAKVLDNWFMLCRRGEG